MHDAIVLDGSGNGVHPSARNRRGALRYRRWALPALAVSSLAVLAALLPPPAAQANYYVQWSCGRIAPNTWCWWGPTAATHTWDRVAASHSYAINLCVKLVAPDSSPELKYAYQCAYSAHLSRFSDQLGRAPYPNTNTRMWALIANGNNSFYAAPDGAADAG
jgi:hypothetical protein